MSAARRTVDSIYDVLRSGAALTPRMEQRSFAALRDIRASDGDVVARDDRAKAAFCRIDPRRNAC